MSGDPKVVVLGVGNLLMADEGVGVRCAQAVERVVPPHVRVIDGGTSTHELLEDLEDLDLLIIVDAVASGRAPGAIVRLEDGSIPSAFSNKLSPHQHGINDLLATLRLLGRAPRRVVLLGVEPKRVALDLELSPEIAAALPALIARVVREIG
ncbi:MAG: hydrogenase maturation protease [Deltaproteobacteria bacterium]|nr:hydrogenase maturation protease [Deltaproteobacteria bacterium]